MCLRCGTLCVALPYVREMIPRWPSRNTLWFETGFQVYDTPDARKTRAKTEGKGINRKYPSPSLSTPLATHQGPLIRALRPQPSAHLNGIPDKVSGTLCPRHNPIGCTNPTDYQAISLPIAFRRGKYAFISRPPCVPFPFSSPLGAGGRHRSSCFKEGYLSISENVASKILQSSVVGSWSNTILTRSRAGEGGSSVL